MPNALPTKLEFVREASDHHTRSAIAFLALALLGAGLRFYQLGARDFWFDESCTHVYVQRLFDPAVGSLPLGERPLAAYYGLVWTWTRLFGVSEIGYRSLSAVASVLTIPILGLIARALAGSTAGWVAAAFAALNPIGLYYAREARPYACWMLLLSVTLGLLVRATLRDRRRDWAGYSLALLLALHFHAFTVWWAPFSVVATSLALDRRAALRHWLVSSLAVAIAYLPMFLLVVLPVAGLGSNAWIADAPNASWRILRSISAFLPAGDYPSHLRGLSLESSDTIRGVSEFVSRITTMAAPGIIVGLAVLSGFAMHQGPDSRLRIRSGRAIFLYSTLAALTFGPLILMEMYSRLGRPCYFVGRYDLVAWPALLVWTSIAIVAGVSLLTRLRPGSARSVENRWNIGLGIVVLLLLLCSLDPLMRLNRTPVGPSLARARAERVAGLVGPADLVLSFSYDRAYLAYYLDRSGFQGRIRSFPSSLDDHIGWVDTHTDLATETMDALSIDAAARLRDFADVQRNGGTVWILPDSLDPSDRGPRGPIHRVLREELRRTGYRLTVVDDLLMIVRVEPPQP